MHYPRLAKVEPRNLIGTPQTGYLPHPDPLLAVMDYETQVILHFFNASEDLRRTTSHETDGQAKLRTRSGIASDFLFISSHCSVVKIK